MSPPPLCHHTFKNSPMQTLSSGTLKLFYSNNAILVLHHRPFLFGFILCVTFVTPWSCFITVSDELYELMNLWTYNGNSHNLSWVVSIPYFRKLYFRCLNSGKEVNFLHSPLACDIFLSRDTTMYGGTIPQTTSTIASTDLTTQLDYVVLPTSTFR